MQITSASITPTKKWLIINGETTIDETSFTLKTEMKMYDPQHPQYDVLVEAVTRMGLLGPVTKPSRKAK